MPVRRQTPAPQAKFLTFPCKHTVFQPSETPFPVCGGSHEAHAVARLLRPRGQHRRGRPGPGRDHAVDRADPAPARRGHGHHRHDHGRQRPRHPGRLAIRLALGGALRRARHHAGRRVGGVAGDDRHAVHRSSAGVERAALPVRRRHGRAVYHRRGMGQPPGARQFARTRGGHVHHQFYLLPADRSCPRGPLQRQDFVELRRLRPAVFAGRAGPDADLERRPGNANRKNRA